MQGLERKLVTMANTALAKALYPDSPYSRETGGLMAALRDEKTMNMTEVRAYHREAYVPNNALVCFMGSGIEADVLLKRLDDVDARIAHLRRPGMVRPFSGKLPRLDKNTSVHQLFPAESEDQGRVDIGWRLDGTLSELTRTGFLTGLSVLTSYLCDGIASPLYVALVDQARSCRTVDSTLDLYAEPSVSICMQGVPTHLLESVQEQLMNALLEQVQGGFDLPRIHRVIERSLLDEISDFEQGPSESLQDNAALAFLYFDMTQMPDVLWGEQERMKALLEQPLSYWIEMIDKTLVRRPRVGKFDF